MWLGQVNRLAKAPWTIDQRQLDQSLQQLEQLLGLRSWGQP